MTVESWKLEGRFFAPTEIRSSKSYQSLYGKKMHISCERGACYNVISSRRVYYFLVYFPAFFLNGLSRGAQTLFPLFVHLKNLVMSCSPFSALDFSQESVNQRIVCSLFFVAPMCYNKNFSYLLFFYFFLTNFCDE